MGFEMESVWQAMKGSHYKRVREQMTRDIRQTGDLDAALKAALGAVVTAIHAETGTLWLYDKATNRLLPRSVYQGSDLTGVTLRPGEGIAGQVMASCESVIIRDCQKDSRWAGRVDAKTGFQTKTMLCVPLAVGGVGYGSIQIINHREGQMFDEKDLSFAQELAREVTPLLQEKNLLPELPKEPEHLRALTVSELLTCRNVEATLSTLPEYLQLSLSRQREVVKLCKELQKCFPQK